MTTANTLIDPARAPVSPDTRFAYGIGDGIDRRYFAVFRRTHH